jgi:hypothetical protein
MTDDVTPGADMGGFLNFVGGDEEDFSSKSGAGREHTGFGLAGFGHLNNIKKHMAVGTWLFTSIGFLCSGVQTR